MIARHDQPSVIDAGRRFAEWASHLPGGLFVMLEVYADESGTHDTETGKEVCSEVAVIGGYRLPIYMRLLHVNQQFHSLRAENSLNRHGYLILLSTKIT